MRRCVLSSLLVGAIALLPIASAHALPPRGKRVRMPRDQRVIKVFRGHFGPRGRSALVLTQDKELSGPFGGFAIHKAPNGKGYVRTALPKLKPSWAGWDVKGVVSHGGATVIMAEYMTGIGPTGAQPFQANTALRWNKAKRRYEVDAHLTQRVEGMTSIKHIARALRGN